MEIKLSSIEPRIMAGADMLAFQQSQGGDPCYIDLQGKPVKLNPNYQYLVTLDNLEKNSVVIKTITNNDKK